MKKIVTIVRGRCSCTARHFYLLTSVFLIVHNGDAEEPWYELTYFYSVASRLQDGVRFVALMQFPAKQMNQKVPHAILYAPSMLTVQFGCS